MGAKKIEIEIETVTFAAKIDRNRSFLKKTQTTQHYTWLARPLRKTTTVPSLL